MPALLTIHPNTVINPADEPAPTPRKQGKGSIVLSPTAASVPSPIAASVPNPITITKVVITENFVTPPTKGWHDRAVTYLTESQLKLDEIPNLPFQSNYDSIVECFEKKFECLNKFNNWLEGKVEGPWYKQLALFLAKLPLHAVKNIIHTLYKLIKEIFTFAVHPQTALLKIARLLVDFIHALSQPETWSRLGAGIVGFSLGAGLSSGNPFSVLGLVLGTSMAIFGISFGALKAAIEHAKDKKLEAVKNSLANQSVELPEAILTGFFLGLIVGPMTAKVETHPQHTPPTASMPVKKV